MRRVAGACGLLAFVTFNLGWILGGFAQPAAYSVADDDISDLGAVTASSAWLYNQLAANITATSPNTTERPSIKIGFPLRMSFIPIRLRTASLRVFDGDASSAIDTAMLVMCGAAPKPYNYPNSRSFHYVQVLGRQRRGFCPFTNHLRKRKELHDRVVTAWA